MYAAIIPGPFQAYLLSQTLKNGWKRTLPLALTPILTDGPIIALVLFILAGTPRFLLDILRILGGLFILYIARGLLLSLKKPFTMIGTTVAAKTKGLVNAIILNILNPNPYIFWGVISGPILLSAWRESPGLGVSFLIGFYGIFILSLSALIILFATAGRLNPVVNRGITIFTCGALIVFGVHQFLTGLINVVSRFYPN